MAQSLSASGLSPERSFELARIVERRLADGGRAEVDVASLRALTEEVLRVEESETAVRRFRDWQRLDRLDRPLVVLIGGTTGVGKSTVATTLASRLGITRVIATDVIRQVLRAFFTHEAMPSVHYSAFEAGSAVEEDGEDPDIAGYRDQAERVGTAIAAIVERAASEGSPLVVEGVHVVPRTLEDELSARCIVVEALLVIQDEDRHRGHFSRRPGERPAERYLSRFAEIRKLQAHLAARADAHGMAVIDNRAFDETLGQLMQLVLDAVESSRTAHAR